MQMNFIPAHTTAPGMGTTAAAPIYRAGRGGSERSGNVPRDAQQAAVGLEPRPDLTSQLPLGNHLMARPVKGTHTGTPPSQGEDRQGVRQRQCPKE